MVHPTTLMFNNSVLKPLAISNLFTKFRPLSFCFGSSETLQDDPMWKNIEKQTKNYTIRQRSEKANGPKIKIPIMKFLDELVHDN